MEAVNMDNGEGGGAFGWRGAFGTVMPELYGQAKLFKRR